MNNYTTDSRSPDYEQPPLCDDCNGELTFTEEYDEDLGIFHIGTCEDCKVRSDGNVL